MQHYQAGDYQRCVLRQAVHHYLARLMPALSKEEEVLLHTGTDIGAKVVLGSLCVVACSRVETEVGAEVVYASP